jgi:hypothetical protein
MTKCTPYTWTDEVDAERRALVDSEASQTVSARHRAIEKNFNLDPNYVDHALQCIMRRAKIEEDERLGRRARNDGVIQPPIATTKV